MITERTGIIILFLIILSIIYGQPATAGSELDCLATNIYFEARGESEAGQFMVGFITMNRVNNSKWPGTICRVVYQPGQFVWTEDEHSNDVYKHSIVYKRIVYIASIIMQAKEIEHYGHFFNTTHSISKSTIVAGNHRFY
jgi:spore germination cell wall hydrolase CwlJ-like protein